MPTEYTHLVDHPINDAARAKLNEAIERLKQAEAGVVAAQAATKAAEVAAQLAAAGESDTDPLEAEHALADAAVVLASATRVRDAAQVRREKMHANISLAEAVSWLPVALDGARKRLAACEKGDRARALAEEAEQEFRAADVQVKAARGRGVPVAADAPNDKPRPLAAEQAAWAQLVFHGIDVAGTSTWTPAKYVP